MPGIIACAARDDAAAEGALAAVRDAAADPGRNLMPPLLDAARAHCSEGEIVGALQTVFGTYTETPVF
jgi:methylmalonyl-CoA mutase N-terminal domain/subunit